MTRDDDNAELTDEQLDALLCAADDDILSHVRSTTDPVQGMLALLAENDDTALYIKATGLPRRPDRSQDTAGRRAWTRHPNRKPTALDGRPGEDGSDHDAGHQRKLSLRAMLTVAAAAGVAVSLGFSLHLVSTTQITQAAATNTSTVGTVSTLPGLGQGPPPPQAVWQGDGVVESVRPPYGDQATQFYLYSSGWAPDEKVTVRILGVESAFVEIVAGSDGTFEYPVNGNHEFFAGVIPPGTYQIQMQAGSVIGIVTFTVSP